MKSYVRCGLQSTCNGKFTRMCEVLFAPSSAKGEAPRRWEMVQRVSAAKQLTSFAQSPTALSLDAVEICATLTNKQGRFQVLVLQYRPPLDSYVLEFPAGLIDGEEEPATAALRELREETGYLSTTNDVVSISPPICPEPGLTDSCVFLVRVNIDGTRPENASPVQHLDQGEDIEVYLLPLNGEKKPLDVALQCCKARSDRGQRTIVDAKLYTYLDALSQ